MKLHVFAMLRQGQASFPSPGPRKFLRRPALICWLQSRWTEIVRLFLVAVCSLIVLIVMLFGLIL